MAAKAIAPAATSVTAFVGPAPGGVPLEPMAAASFDDFVRAFGEAPSPLAAAVEAFFTNGGQDARIVALAPSAAGAVEYRAAFDALRATGGFNLLCVLPASGTADVPIELLADALRLSVDQRAMLIVDAPREWSLDSSAAVTRAAAGVETMLGAFAATDPRNAALYFPSLQRGSTGASSPTQIPACGAVAGVFARVDRARGVWKAAAGTEATVLGGVVPAVNLRERDNCLLNALGVNCFRAFSSFGTVVWGARTLHGADRFADQFKYMPDPAVVPLPGEQPDRGSRLDGGRAKRRKHMDRGSRRYARIPATAVDTGRAAGRKARRGGVREMRQNDDDAGRHRQRPPERAGRLRGAQALRVRRPRYQAAGEVVVSVDAA